MIQCSFEDGAKINLRHITVGAIVINEKKQVLLVKRALHLLNGNKYTIPGGFLDRDEDTREAALRELLEETGLRGKILFLFRINDNPLRPKEDRQNVDFIYVVEILSGYLKLNKEVLAIDWFYQNNLPNDAEFAFDHRESILKYFQYLAEPFELPILGPIQNSNI